MTATYRSESGTLLCAGCNQKAISENDEYHDICEKRVATNPRTLRVSSESEQASVRESSWTWKW